jgi:C4-dicarboxylate transporter DctQ subunit
VGLISAAIFFVVAIYGWEQAMKLRQYDVMTSALRLPKYWAYLPIPFFSVFIGIRFLNVSAGHFRSFLANEPFDRVPGRE